MFGTVNAMSKRKAPRTVAQQVGEWVVTMEWPDGVENAGPGRLMIEPSEPDTHPVGGLSSTVLRQIDFRQAIEEFRRQLALSQEQATVSENVERMRFRRIREELNEGVTDHYLAMLSSAYVTAVNRGQAKLNDYLAEMIGKPTNTIRGHLWQARKQGFLTGSPGRKGGRLTPKSTEILERIIPHKWGSPDQTLRRLRDAQRNPSL